MFGCGTLSADYDIYIAGAENGVISRCSTYYGDKQQFNEYELYCNTNEYNYNSQNDIKKYI